ncbi:MAG: GFA family protein [Pseudomonadota bacterium]|nr:GFA family protein [Pseudomonadota bacterium]
MAVNDQARRGGCQCGAARFEARGAPKFVGNCHCNDCRKATGAPFSTFVGFLDGQVTWSGAARRTRESSTGVTRSFCSVCGSPLSYQGAKWPGETHLYIGGFDDPSGLVPTGDVFTDEALAWAPRAGAA